MDTGPNLGNVVCDFPLKWSPRGDVRMCSSAKLLAQILQN